MFDIKIALSILGIYFAYIVMSLFTEKMYIHEYPSIIENQPPLKFTFPVLHVWLGSLFCSIFGLIRSKVINQRPNPISIRQIGLLGILYTLNILGVNVALKYLPFHINLVGRNIRLLVVIIVGIFFSRVKGQFKHKLRISKLFIGIIITIGTILFSIFNESKHEFYKINKQILWFGLSAQNFGYLVLFISVLADAFFADSQAYQKAHYKPTSNHLFISANFAAFLICLGYSFVHPEDNIVQHYKFVVNHPSVVKQLLLINSLQVLGQVCIYYVIANCSQHIFPLVSTTRRIVTFILSVFIYGHIVQEIQIISFLIILIGIGLEYYDQNGQKQQKQKIEIPKLKQQKVETKIA